MIRPFSGCMRLSEVRVSLRSEFHRYVEQDGIVAKMDIAVEARFGFAFDHFAASATSAGEIDGTKTCTFRRRGILSSSSS